jgi:hypothetical protein
VPFSRRHAATLDQVCGAGTSSASPETVDVWVVADTAHTGALATHPDEWEQRVTTFLDDALDVNDVARPERLE